MPDTGAGDNEEGAFVVVGDGFVSAPQRIDGCACRVGAREDAGDLSTRGNAYRAGASHQEPVGFGALRKGSGRGKGAEKGKGCMGSHRDGAGRMPPGSVGATRAARRPVGAMRRREGAAVWRPQGECIAYRLSAKALP